MGDGVVDRDGCRERDTLEDVRSRMASIGSCVCGPFGTLTPLTDLL